MQVRSFEDVELLQSSRVRAKAPNPFDDVVKSLEVGVTGAIALEDVTPDDKEAQKAIRQFRSAAKGIGLGVGTKAILGHEKHGNCIVLWLKEPKKVNK